ncbi:MAG: hypothetical protein AUG51_02840 [Acidobacteria bacterium 13_1_20CM_3_53_8]|nr:MAG: hypothetical protein AUG51_02840 [Acidobacteria bacterium 13_1_20CM_3_53_8]
MQTNNQIAKSSKRELLAQTIAQEFKDLEHVTRYLQCCKKYPHFIVYRAYAEAKAMPTEQIRKSRQALFFYLLKKYAHERNHNTVH